MQVDYVSHASLLVTTPAGRLLTDPYFRMDRWERSMAAFFPPHRVDVDALHPLRWIFISHAHSDHAHPLSLRALQRGQRRLPTVLIPSRRPALRALLERAGVVDIQEVAHLKPLELAPGVWAMVVLHPNHVDSTLIFHAHGHTLAACSDCFLPPELAAAAIQRAPLDAAFVPHTSAQDLHPFVLDLPEAQLEALATQREQHDQQLLLAQAAVLHARLTVPYAYALAYRQPDQRHLNHVGHTLPEEFCAAFAERFPGQRAQAMWPGDALDVVSAEIVRGQRPRAMDGTRSGFLAAVDAHVRKRPPPSWDHGSIRDATPWIQQQFGGGMLASPLLRPLAGKVVHLVVQGRRTSRTWTLPLGTHAALDGAQGTPDLTIHIPACLVPPILDGSHDPFMALYSYRVRFTWARTQRFARARHATDHAVDLFEHLFTPRRLWL